MISKLEVFMQEKRVGTLAMVKDRRVAFEYDSDWLLNGFSISPFSLPLEKKVFVSEYNPFMGLFGVFNDSLPDGWGKLLVDRMLSKNHLVPSSLNVLERLAIVGDGGAGALSYRPAHQLINVQDEFNLDEICMEAEKLLNNEEVKNLDILYNLGGSSGGARPKIYTTYENEKWIIKFPAQMDPKDIGKQEYRYAVCARNCGIDISEVNLFPSDVCAGYFGTKRFDREIDTDGKEKRRFMISASALLETSHRISNLDYHVLMKLTKLLTNDYDEMLKMYKLMCFNVFSHNRDDHAKNFSYLYDEDKKCWKLSPAYDLTYSNSLHGEHATTINGNGINPSIDDIVEVGIQAGISKKQVLDIAKSIKNIVSQELQEYLK